MLTKKSKYAIKALVALARHYETEGPLRIAEIAESENIPAKFLETILLELRKHGILGSKKGVNGGYYLIKDPNEVMLSNVMRITDGPIALIPCVSLNFYEKCEECADEVTCGLREIALKVRDASLEILANTSIGDMVKREKQLAVKAKKK
ncbi:MAG: Rrf2 family transcriptional regulator [Bacteroidetes bacterium]|nr:Rrf2 family transcriptional regulator [Bacteroidota bacterium]